MRARYVVAATAVAGVVGLSIAGGIVVRATGANLERGRLSAQQDAYRAQRDAAGTHCVWSDQTWWQPRYVLDGSDASAVAGCAALNSTYRAQHEAVAKAGQDAENQRAARQAADDAAAAVRDAADRQTAQEALQAAQAAAAQAAAQAGQPGATIITPEPAVGVP